jgi:hypothetical protein
MHIIQNMSLLFVAKNYKRRIILWSYFKHRRLAFTLLVQKEPTFGLFLVPDGSCFLQRYAASSTFGTRQLSSARKPNAWFWISNKMQMEGGGLS